MDGADFIHREAPFAERGLNIHLVERLPLRAGGLHVLLGELGDGLAREALELVHPLLQHDRIQLLGQDRQLVQLLGARRALAEAEAEKTARIGIAQALAVEEQVRAYGGPQFQVTQQVMEKFANAIREAKVDVVPRILIKGNGGEGDTGTGSVIEALMAMLLSDKLGVSVADDSTPRSAEAEELRKSIRESMKKSSSPGSGEEPKKK